VGAQHATGMGMTVCVLLWCSSTLVCLFLQFVVSQDFHQRGPKGGPPAPAQGQEGEVIVVLREMRVATTQVSANTRLASRQTRCFIDTKHFVVSTKKYWTL
jgi:hypothetical protein